MQIWLIIVKDINVTHNVYERIKLQRQIECRHKFPKKHSKQIIYFGFGIF